MISGKLEAAAASVAVSEAVETGVAKGAVVVTESETEGSGIGVSADDASIFSVEVVPSDGGARVGNTVNMESEVEGSKVGIEGSRDEDSGGTTSLVDSSGPVVDDVSVLITGRSWVLVVGDSSMLEASTLVVSGGCVDDSTLMTVGSSALVEERASVDDGSSEDN